MLIAISGMIADSENSSAQLLQRLRDRIQSRAIAPLPSAGQYRRPGEIGQQPLRQPTVPNYNPAQPPNPNRLDGSGTPRRVAPVDPKQAVELQTGDGPSNDEMDVAQDGVSVQSRNVLPNQTAARLPIDGSADANAASGSSILIRQDNQKPRLGIQVVESRQGIEGLLVTGINPNSVAEKAGLMVGDLLVELQDQPTRTSAQVTQILASNRGADEVRLRIVRNNRLALISIPISTAAMNEVAAAANSDLPDHLPSPVESINNGSAPRTTPASKPVAGTAPGAATAAEPSKRQKPAAVPQSAVPQNAVPGTFGLQFRNVAGQRGAIVTGIRPDSPAAASGLKIDDRIVSVDGRLLVDAESLNNVLEQTGAGLGLRLMAVRDGKLVSAKLDPKHNKNGAQRSQFADSAKENSTLKGLGAAIGGLLSSGKAKTKSLQQDEMALGDDEGVQPVDFQSDDPETDAESAASPDPLSLEALEIPDSEETTELLPPKKPTE